MYMCIALSQPDLLGQGGREGGKEGGREGGREQGSKRGGHFICARHFGFGNLRLFGRPVLMSTPFLSWRSSCYTAYPTANVTSVFATRVGRSQNFGTRRVCKRLSMPLFLTR